MKKVAKMDVELTVEERNLLSVGYKNVIGSRRASWRILSSIEQKEESRGNEQNAKRIKEYRQKVESELTNICSDIMTVIDEHLIPSSTAGESTVFYYKMWGRMFCLFHIKQWFEILYLVPNWFSFTFTGKGIIIGILRNLRQVMIGKRLLISHWKHMRYISGFLFN